MGKIRTIDEYIKGAPDPAQEKLHEIRLILKEVAPQAKEKIKWGAPVFEEERILFAFAAFKDHLNFMPTHSSIEHFKEELENYSTGKESIRFPFDKPLPKELIRKIASYRRQEVLEHGARWMLTKQND